MNSSTILYRFHIDLSDVERGVYEQLDFRIPRHPSESVSYMLTRVLAYALNYQEGLEFSSQGLGEPEGPTISVQNPQGGTLLWIEIGNPSARKLHKASKASDQVKVYTYKDPQHIVKECESEKVHQAEKIQIVAFPGKVLELLGESLTKDVRLGLLFQDGTLSVTLGSHSVEIEVRPVFLKVQ